MLLITELSLYIYGEYFWKDVAKKKAVIHLLD